MQVGIAVWPLGPALRARSQRSCLRCSCVGERALIFDVDYRI
jgi:hypothetical protein